MNKKAKRSDINNTACTELKELLAERTGTVSSDWHLTFRAREAMQAVFEEVRKVRGDGSVILQPFTCSTVPEAVLASGMDLCLSYESSPFVTSIRLTLSEIIFEFRLLMPLDFTSSLPKPNHLNLSSLLIWNKLPLSVLMFCFFC